MITEDNNRNFLPEEQDAKGANQGRNNVNPDQRTDSHHHWDNAKMSPNIGKSAIQNERSNLQADQEKRPSEHNPEHGNKKV